MVVSLCRKSVLAVLFAAVCVAQSPQALITGRVTDLRTGAPLRFARVIYADPAKGIRGEAPVNSTGYYYLTLLSPGAYQIRVQADGFQAQERYELAMPVAGRLDLDFRLRPLADVWGQARYRSYYLPESRRMVNFFGPDVDTSIAAEAQSDTGRLSALEAAVSTVVDQRQIMDLPLAGRDVYTMLVTQPGVTADTTTARSLGLSSMGQRPSSSNFLLDGLEANNQTVSGPLSPVAPEMVQEYRVSTSNFTAEYGRASGYIANAVTKSGGSEWHGLGYFYLKNEVLDATDVAPGDSKHKARELQPGIWVGGPILRERLFYSGAVEVLRSRGVRDSQCYRLPTPSFIQSVTPGPVRDLLERYKPMVSASVSSPGCEVPASLEGRVASVSLTRPVTVDRTISLQRLDYLTPGGGQKLMFRYALSRVGRADYYWWPYPDFVSPLNDNADSFAIVLSSRLRPALTNELRLGPSFSSLDFDRPNTDVGYIRDFSGDVRNQLYLPGHSSTVGLHLKRRSFEIQDNLMWLKGRHIINVGGGLLSRGLTAKLSVFENSGEYFYTDLDQLRAGRLLYTRFAIDRQALAGPAASRYVQPNYEHEYRIPQAFGFAQDTWRLSRRLVINYGLRIEHNVSPTNTGPNKEVLLRLGAGNTLTEQVRAGMFVPGENSGDQSLFANSSVGINPRFGVSFDVTGAGNTLVRAAWGMFQDRPFDNIWQNTMTNNWVYPIDVFAVPGNAIMDPAAPLNRSLFTSQLPPRFVWPTPTVLSSSFRTPYARNWFSGVQHRMTSNLLLEANLLGSQGVNLITTDLVNRGQVDQFGFVLRGTTGPVSYRANDGRSSYIGFAASGRWQFDRGFLMGGWTVSRSRDNQSETLRNDYFNLSPTRLSSPDTRTDLSAFTIEGNPSHDWGYSDFDQRHGLVLLGSVETPHLTEGRWWRHVVRDWRFSQLSAFRTGTPYSVLIPRTPGSAIVNNRANLIAPATAVVDVPVPGGKQMLDARAFESPCTASGCVLGNTARNQFRGPGFYNVDISVARSFAVPKLREGTRITLRADVFNILNHKNLTQPNNVFVPGSATFGVASYGRRGSQGDGLPDISPLSETDRRVQLMLRLSF